MGKCSGCGREVGGGLKFCTSCGQPVVEAGGPKCPKCGMAQTKPTKFCVGCGEPMEGGGAPARAVPPPPPGMGAQGAMPPPPPGIGAQGAMPPPAAARPPMMAPAGYGPAPVKKKGGAGLIIGLVVGLAVLGAGGYFGYKKFLAKGETTETAATQGAETGAAQPAPESGAAEIPVEMPAAAAGSASNAPVRTAPSQPAARSEAAESPAQWPPVAAPAAAQQEPPPAVATPPAAAEPARETVKAPQRTPVFRAEPEPPARQPEFATRPAASTAARYTGPTSGMVIWSGPLRKDGVITIDGGQASAGTVQGGLPGVPVMLETDNKDVGFAEMPGPSNGWKKVGIRGRKNQNVVVTLRWKVVQ